MSEMATSEVLVAPPGFPVVCEWLLATTDPILMTPLRIETPDASDDVSASSRFFSGWASAADWTAPDVTAGPSASVGVPGPPTLWATECRSTSGPASHFDTPYPIGGAGCVSPCVSVGKKNFVSTSEPG